MWEQKTVPSAVFFPENLLVAKQQCALQVQSTPPGIVSNIFTDRPANSGNILYAFFWVITRRLDFICRRFGTLCLFHLHRQVDVSRIDRYR